MSIISARIQTFGPLTQIASDFLNRIQDALVAHSKGAYGIVQFNTPIFNLGFTANAVGELTAGDSASYALLPIPVSVGVKIRRVTLYWYWATASRSPVNHTIWRRKSQTTAAGSVPASTLVVSNAPAGIGQYGTEVAQIGADATPYTVIAGEQHFVFADAAAGGDKFLGASVELVSS